jgi:hypothetical protein
MPCSCCWSYEDLQDELDLYCICNRCDGDKCAVTYCAYGYALFTYSDLLERDGFVDLRDWIGYMEAEMETDLRHSNHLKARKAERFEREMRHTMLLIFALWAAGASLHL